MQKYHFHERLRKYRVSRGLSVKELAKRIGVPASTYREWEYGRPLAGPPYVKIAEELAVPLTTLMTGNTAELSWIVEYIDEIELKIKNLKTRAVSRI